MKSKRRRKRRTSNPYGNIVKTTGNAATAIVGISAVSFVAAKATDALPT